jgi:hypothetical protein
MEVVRSSKMLVNYCQTTQRHIQEDSTLQQHNYLTNRFRCEKEEN